MKGVVGQGSCGVATGAKKTAAEFERQIADRQDVYKRQPYLSYMFTNVDTAQIPPG